MDKEFYKDQDGLVWTRITVGKDLILLQNGTAKLWFTLLQIDKFFIKIDDKNKLP